MGQVVSWINIASLAVAVIALLLSFCSFIVSFRAFRLAQRQDNRRQPSLVSSLLNGYVQFLEETRVYAFLLSISNISDSNNALAKIELHVGYERSTGTLVTAHIPASQSRGDALAKLSDFVTLPTPARLDAHQTLTGWVIFRVSEEILKDARIEGYSVVIF